MPLNENSSTNQSRRFTVIHDYPSWNDEPSRISWVVAVDGPGAIHQAAKQLSKLCGRKIIGDEFKTHAIIRGWHKDEGDYV